MISDGSGEIPHMLEYSNSQNNLVLINLKGEKKLTNYSISAETIHIPLDGMIKKLEYTIEESGIGIYYFDLYLRENNDEIVLTYKGYAKQN
jgi:hypothetical protein